MKTAPYLRSALLVLFGLALAHHAHAQAPKLSIVSVGNRSFVLSWPATASDYVLESVEKLDAVTAWRAVAERPTLANAELQLVIIIKDGAQFFRLSFVPPHLLAGDFEIGDYTIVSSTSISPSVYEDTYKANVSNWGAADATVTASLTSTATQITVVEGGLSFGDVPVGATIESTDTFTVSHDRSKPFDSAALVWTMVAKSLPPTTFALIDKALADGRINAETALVYKVYDDFNDDRLPSLYRGRNDGFPDGSAMLEAERLFATLSPATRQLLAPFRLLPTDSGSWVEIQASMRTAPPPGAREASVPVGAVLHGATSKNIQWATIKTKNGKVRIWWMTELRPGDEARAQAIAGEIDRYLWLKLTVLMGEPLPIPSGDGAVRLDIYLTSKRRPEAKPLTGFDASGKQICVGEPMPAVILFGPNDTNSDLAHEIMHAILHGYKLKSCFEPAYKWMHEATATWAEHFAYPLPNPEHGGNGRRGAYSYLKDPTYPLVHKDDDREYGAYLWFFFLTRGVSKGTPPYVRQIWNGAAALDGASAINAAIQDIGGFKKQWPEFVLYNWNRMEDGGQPYRYYHDWDKLKHKAKENGPIKVKLNGKSSATETMSHYLPQLTADYFHYDFESDTNIRRIDFTNPVYSGGTIPGAKVQAIVKIRGQDWKPAEDWTALAKKRFCRDLTAEDIEQLVIVISNSEFTGGTVLGASGQPPELKVSALGCNPWIGSVQFSYSDSLDESGSKIEVTETATASNVTFELVDPDDGSYKATSGIVTWKHTGSASLGFGALQCSGEASGTFLVTAGDSVMAVTTFSPPFGDDSTLFYSGGGEVNFLQVNIDPIVYPCNPFGNFPTLRQQRFRKWLMTNAHIPPASFDKIIIDSDGNLVMKGDSKQGPDKWHWEFKQVRKTP